ncbi:hypothetical protein LJ737_04815 [Hymenobacter sp. 15J16-1T3B]|nr:hypothetical protein [Hymenobacter sp. 15J16-1T3B]
MLQIESNNGFSKFGCYLLAGLCGLCGLLMLRQHNFHQQPGQGWLYLLLIVLVGVVPPLVCASALKRYRLSIDHEMLLLELLPATVLAQQPMQTLQRWEVSKPGRGYSVGEILTLGFRQGDPVRIYSAEYGDFSQLVSFLQSHYPAKKSRA